jgi:hypothetical protein
MNGPLFIDTNVLLYSISRDPAEARKRDIAVAIVDTDNLALSVQSKRFTGYRIGTRLSLLPPALLAVASCYPRIWAMVGKSRALSLLIPSADIEWTTSYVISNSLSLTRLPAIR